ncbi:hypothetical protein M413DRAFT_277883 [Hebeloma cylindrosporum]|uniref:Uncharacterized protein n=1 Tax=Hebeloma cylindrosporum TaxID=76867 RepID=A0A0C3BZ73_HEBCY|nr:hypothetical protein M413DRAFT_277883 [Hebeloma cylindrosporum h7]
MHYGFGMDGVVGIWHLVKTRRFKTWNPEAITNSCQPSTPSSNPRHYQLGGMHYAVCITNPRPVCFTTRDIGTCDRLYLSEFQAT